MVVIMYVEEVSVYSYSYVCIKLLYTITVLCPPLTNPDNGIVDCSLGDNGVSSYEDTCSFTCNTSYELTGSDTRTCQSNRSWSGIEITCSIGIL